MILMGIYIGDNEAGKGISICHGPEGFHKNMYI
jgi:hypothetical protein